MKYRFFSYIEDIILSIKSNFASHNYSIKSRLTFGFLLMIVPILFVAIISQNTSIKTIKDSSINSTVLAVNQSANYVGSIMSSTHNISVQIISQINNSDSMRHYISEYTLLNESEQIQTQSEIERLLTSYVDTRSYISKVVLLTDKESSVGVGRSGIGSFSKNNIDFNLVKNSSWYKEALKKDGEVIWLGKHPEIDKSFSIGGIETYSISAVRAIKGAFPDTYSGILIIDIDTQPIQKLFTEMSIADNSKIFLMSPDGRMSYSDNTKGSCNFYNELNASNLNYTNFLKNLTSAEGQTTVVDNGSQYLLAYSTIDASGFLLAGFFPTENVFSITNKIIQTTIFTVLVVVIAALWFGLTISRSISNALNKTVKDITFISEQAANGDLTNEAKCDRKDELGLLTENINSMIGNMKKLITRVFVISNKVIEYTETVADLTKQAVYASQNITQSIENITIGASDQASEATQCVKKMDELSSKISDISDNVRIIEKFASDVITISKDPTGMDKQSLHIFFDNLSAVMWDLASKVTSIEGRIVEMENNKEVVVESIDSILSVSQDTALAVEEVTGSTEEQLAALEELTTLAQELNDFAKELNQAIHNFKI